VGWYIVIKTIKGHRYRYRQRTWREGGRVRTESIYLGPADGGRSVNPASGAGAKVASGASTASIRPPSVSGTAARVPEEAIHQLTPFTAHLKGKDRREYERERERQRREDERIQYGPRAARVRKMEAKIRAAKRKTAGIKKLNPFIALGIKKKDK